jgi:hypothetical protein
VDTLKKYLTRKIMIPPDEKEVERLAKWMSKYTRFFSILLEVGIFGTIAANRSTVGLILCTFYAYFSVSWAAVEDGLDGFWKEKK